MYRDCHCPVQAPLLALFGSLQPQDYVRRNMEAIAAAKERAMRNLQRCVVANTDDMRASAELVSYVTFKIYSVFSSCNHAFQLEDTAQGRVCYQRRFMCSRFPGPILLP